MCANCGAKHLRHRMCPNCGNYRGRVVVDIVAKREKRTTRYDAKLKRLGVDVDAKHEAEEKKEKTDKKTNTKTTAKKTAPKKKVDKKTDKEV